MKKHNQDDDALRQRFHKEARRPDDNPWFTHRVLNRLPERRRRYWMTALCYGLALLGCVLLWVGLIHGHDNTVVTVRDVLYFFAMLSVSAVLLWQIALTWLPRD